MERVLGLDFGTNSIGWAIVQHNDDSSYSLLDKGVNIFQDGVAHDRSGEKPMVIWMGIHIMIDMCTLRKILTYLSFPRDISGINAKTQVI